MPGIKAENESKPLDFEAAMRDLEEIVERLEHGDLPLEESLRGVRARRHADAQLPDSPQGGGAKSGDLAQKGRSAPGGRIRQLEEPKPNEGTLTT